MSDDPALPRILCVAMWIDGNLVVTLPQPARHHDLFPHARSLSFTIAQTLAAEQGFMTDDGRFVSRAKAAWIAAQAGQRLRVTGSETMLGEEGLRQLAGSALGSSKSRSAADAGHPVTWDALIAGTVLQGNPYG